MRLFVLAFASQAPTAVGWIASSVLRRHCRSWMNAHKAFSAHGQTTASNIVASYLVKYAFSLLHCIWKLCSVVECGSSPGIFLDPPRGVYTPDFQSTPLQFKKKKYPLGGVINYWAIACYRHGIHVQKCHGASPASLIGRNVWSTFHTSVHCGLISKRSVHTVIPYNYDMIYTIFITSHFWNMTLMLA